MPRQLDGVGVIGSQSCSLGTNMSTKDSIAFRSRNGLVVGLSEWRRGKMQRRDSRFLFCVSRQEVCVTGKGVCNSSDTAGCACSGKNFVGIEVFVVL